MAQILISDLSQETLDQLKRHADSRGGSLEAEIKELLERAAAKPTTQQLRQRMDELARRIGPQTTDSVDLIREDRER